MNQRERFNRWYNDEWDKELITSPEDVEEAWSIWQAACPDGWQCVPKEPTQEMWKAMTPYDGVQYSDAFDCGDFFSDYKALLSAAPKPEDV